MIAELTCKEAYMAAIHDIYAAERNYEIAARQGNAGDKAAFLHRELAYLWQRRIERGELPPIETPPDVRFVRSQVAGAPGAR